MKRLSHTVATVCTVMFRGLMFHGWQLGNHFCNFIFMVLLYPSCGMYVAILIKVKWRMKMS